MVTSAKIPRGQTETDAAIAATDTAIAQHLRTRTQLETELADVRCAECTFAGTTEQLAGHYRVTTHRPAVVLITDECRWCEEPVDDLQRFTDQRGRLFCSQTCLNWGSR